MGTIFISYRRDDSDATVGRIWDHLKARFGEEKVFRDKNSIPIGAWWRSALDEALAQCDVMVVVIGPKWLNCHDQAFRRRLDLPDDYVRKEIEVALGRDIPLLPILVEDAQLPPADYLPESIRLLVERQAYRVDGDPKFARDMRDVLAALPPSIVPASDVGIMSVRSPGGVQNPDDLIEAGWTVDELTKSSNVLMDNQRYALAIPLLVRATRLASNDPGVWALLGAAYRFESYFGPDGSADERLQDALAAFDRQVELDPRDPEAWLSKGEVHHELIEYDEALAALDSGLTALTDGNRRKSELSLWQARASVLHDMGREDEAEEAQRRAELAPSPVADDPDDFDFGEEGE